MRNEKPATKDNKSKVNHGKETCGDGGEVYAAETIRVGEKDGYERWMVSTTKLCCAVLAGDIALRYLRNDGRIL